MHSFTEQTLSAGSAPGLVLGPFDVISYGKAREHDYTEAGVPAAPG